MPNYLTKQGFENLQTELNKIINVSLPENKTAIAVAKEDGDLKENAAYQTAMKTRDELVARRDEIELILGDYEIVEESKTKPNSVQFGATVEIKYLDTNKEYEFKVVGPSESDILDNKVSVDSPLVQSILNKKEGESSTFKTPTGKLTIKILKIK